MYSIAYKSFEELFSYCLLEIVMFGLSIPLAYVCTKFMSKEYIIEKRCSFIMSYYQGYLTNQSGSTNISKEVLCSLSYLYDEHLVLHHMCLISSLSCYLKTWKKKEKIWYFFSTLQLSFNDLLQYSSNFLKIIRVFSYIK